MQVYNQLYGSFLVNYKEGFYSATRIIREFFFSKVLIKECRSVSVTTKSAAVVRVGFHTGPCFDHFTDLHPYNGTQTHDAVLFTTSF